MVTDNGKLYHEKYHDNCHDYLKKFYLEKYTVDKYKSLLYEIKENIPILRICDEINFEDYAKVVVCDQHAVVFGHYLDVNPILATYALNACVGLVIYIPKYKIGCLAHIDGLPGYSQQSAIEDGIHITIDPIEENLKLIMNKMENIIGQSIKTQIDFYLIGGIFGLSEVMIHDILQCIKNFKKRYGYQFRFCGRNLLGPDNQSRNICLDLDTGIISYFSYLSNSEFYGKHRNSDNTPINVIRAPRTSEAYLDITYMPFNTYSNKPFQ